MFFILQKIILKYFYDIKMFSRKFFSCDSIGDRATAIYQQLLELLLNGQQTVTLVSSYNNHKKDSQSEKAVRPLQQQNQTEADFHYNLIVKRLLHIQYLPILENE